MADTVSTKNPPRSRREEEKEKRREAIIDAAEHVIARHGFEGLDFGKVATRAKLSRPLVYFYFSAKDELVDAITARGMEQLIKRFSAALAAHRKGIDQLMAIGRAYCEFGEQEPLYFSLLSQHQEKCYDPDNLSPISRYAQDLGNSCVGCVVQALTNGVADGTIRKTIGDPRSAAISVWALTHGLIQISSRKACVLELEFKLSPKSVIEHGLGLLRSSVAADR